MDETKSPINKILLLGSTRQTGKDTLCALLTRLDSRLKRYSFADPLRDDMNCFISDRFGIDIWLCTSEEKELIRPMMIAYGMAQRKRDPNYWVKRTLYNIEGAWQHHPMMIPIITDCRFMNELTLTKEAYPQTRFLQLFREGAPPPTEEEDRHWPEIAAKADKILRWGENTEEERAAQAGLIYDWLKKEWSV